MEEERVKYLGRIGAVSVVLLLSTYYAVNYYLHYGELTVFEFSGDIIYIGLAWWGGLHFDKARVLAKELRRKQQELQSILDYNVDAVVIRDLKGNILEVNPAFEKMTGFTKEEVIGKLAPFIEGREEDITQLIQDVLEKGEISGYKIIREKKNGELFYGNISLSLIRDRKGNPERIVGIKRDITEQEKDELAVKESEERYRTLVEFCPDAIFVHSKGKIVFSNKAGLELIGASHEDDLLGKSIWILVDPEYRKLVEERIKVSQETNSVPSLIEERFISLDGRKLSVEVTTMAIMYMGKQANQVIVRDITDKKISEEKLKETNEILKRLSSLDGLTGIANRRYFDEYLGQEWNNAIEQKDILSLIMLDIDFFKKYNDTYGHLGGDECLKQVAGLLDTISKQSGAIAARYGGEEFVVILPKKDREEALEIAETIRIGIEELAIPHITSEIKDVVTLSIGVSTCHPVLTVKPKDLIQAADIALYDSKRLGRNRVCECGYSFIS